MDAAPAPAIRVATVDDIEAYLDVYEAVAAEGRWIGGELPVDRDSRRPWLRRVVETDDELLLVAEAGGTVVGGLSMEMRNGIAEFGMALLADQRGRGTGRRLLVTAIDWARDAGAHKVTLQAWPHNAAAIGLYESLGFVTEGRFRRQWRRRDGSLWDSVFMGLVLDEDAPGSPWPSA